VPSISYFIELTDKFVATVFEVINQPLQLRLCLSLFC
jgi:hypothetical protein